MGFYKHGFLQTWVFTNMGFYKHGFLQIWASTNIDTFPRIKQQYDAIAQVYLSCAEDNLGCRQDDCRRGKHGNVCCRRNRSLSEHEAPSTDTQNCNFDYPPQGS